MSDRFDILTLDQQEAVMNALDFSMGARLGAVINQLGMDESVRIAPRSAKQLKRYIDGDEPPMTVLQNLCRAVGASLDWLIEAEPRSKVDCRLEQRLLEGERARRKVSVASAATDVDRLTHEFALAAIDGLLEIAEKDSERLPDRSFSEASLAENKLRLRAGAVFESNRNFQNQQQAQAVANTLTDRKDFVAVPLYNVQAAAGNGIVPVDEQEPREEIILTRSFLRRLGAQAESCHIIFAKGESMQPTIPDGSLLLIDLSKSQIVDNGVFVFRVGEDIKVKRARWRIDHRLDLVSDNQLAGYPPETYTLDEAATIQPIGRVMCIMRVP